MGVTFLRKNDGGGCENSIMGKKGRVRVDKADETFGIELGRIEFAVLNGRLTLVNRNVVLPTTVLGLGESCKRDVPGTRGGHGGVT